MDEWPWTQNERMNLTRLRDWCSLVLKLSRATAEDGNNVRNRRSSAVKDKELVSLLAKYGNDVGAMLEWVERASALLDPSVPTTKFADLHHEAWKAVVQHGAPAPKPLLASIDSLIQKCKEAEEKLPELEILVSSSESETSSESEDESEGGDDETASTRSASSN